MLWADARRAPHSDAGTTLADHGDGIHHIADLSGAGNHIRQASTRNQLRWNATDGTWESNDQSGNQLTYMSTSSLNINRRSFSLYVVMKDTVTLIDGDIGLHTVFATTDGKFKLAWAKNTTSGPARARVLCAYDGSWHCGSTKIPTSASLFGIACGASNCQIVVNNSIETISTLAAGTTRGGSTWFGIAPASRADPIVGGIRLALAQNVQSSADEIANLWELARDSFGAIDPDDVHNVVVWLGDSITDAAGTTMNQGYQRAARKLMPKAVEYSVALGGQTVQQFIAKHLATAGEYSIEGKRNILFTFGGTNDIAKGRTATQVYTDLCAISSTAKAIHGFDKVATSTMLPRNGTDSERASLNALTLANVTRCFDAIADWGGDPQMGQNGQNGNSFYHDGTHPNEAGYLIGGARHIGPMLKPLLLDYGGVR
jgi:hypothetical protein